MNRNIPTELIEKYLSGKDLTQEERNEVEKALQQDDGTLQQKFDDIMSAQTWNKELFAGIRFAGEQRLKKKIKGISGNLMEEGLLLDDEDIEAWLKDQLDTSKSAIFNKRLESDDEFAGKVSAEKALLVGIGDYGKNRLKSKIENARKSLEQESFFEEEKKQAKVVPMNQRRRWLAVAAVLALLLAAYLWFFRQSTPDVQVLYAQNFTVYPDKISGELKSELDASGFSGSPEEAKWQELLTAMKSYPDSFSTLEIFIGKYPDEYIARFYLAQAQIANGQIEAAKSNFASLEKITGFEEQPAVQWYLALIDLKQNNLARSKERLSELKQSSSEFQEQAAKLLTQLP